MLSSSVEKTSSGDENAFARQEIEWDAGVRQSPTQTELMFVSNSTPFWENQFPAFACSHRKSDAATAAFRDSAEGEIGI